MAFLKPSNITSRRMDINKSAPLKHWSFFGVLILAIFFHIMPVVGWNLSQIPGNLGDGRFNMYLLELGYQYLFKGFNGYWESPFMWPEHQVVTYSDNLLGTVPIYSFFRLLSLDRETAYQLWYVSLTVLNYSCCYFALYKILRNSKSATLGAYIFAFSIALLGQIFHAQTFPRFAIPLCFWLVFEFNKTKNITYLGLSAVCLVYQIYCGIYLGLMLCIPYAIYLLILIVMKGKEYCITLKSVKNVIGLILWGGGAAGSLLLLMEPYIKRAKDVGLHGYETTLVALPEIKAYFFVSKASFLWSEWLHIFEDSFENWWNHQHFMGVFGTLGLLLLLIICIQAIIKSKAIIDQTKGLLPIAMSGLIVFALYLKFGDYSAYKLVSYLPGFRAMRAVGRIINLIVFFAGLGLAIGFSLFEKKYSLKANWGFLAVITLLLIDNGINQNFPKMEKEVIQERVDEIVQKMDGFPKGGILSYEPINASESGIVLNIDGMLAAQTMQMISINGYSATAPNGYSPYWKKPSKKNREAWLERHSTAKDSIYVVN